MFINDVMEVNSAQIIQLYREWFRDDDRTRQSLVIKEGIESDLRTCSFLIPTTNDGFAFAHRPFYEYFMSTWINDHVERGQEIHFSVSAKSWGREISQHVTDLLLLTAGIQKHQIIKRFPGLYERFKDMMEPRYVEVMERFSKSMTSASLRDMVGLYRIWFRLGRITRDEPLGGVYGRILNSSQVSLYTGVPFAAIMTPLYRRRVAMKFTGAIYLGFARSILSPLIPRWDLRGVDFRLCDLRGFDFSGLDLAEADFREARLDGTRFIDCNLARVDFRQTDFDRAYTTNAYLEEAMLPDTARSRV
jgi:hypothetical protein